MLTATGGSLVVCLLTPAAAYLSADSRYANAPLPLRDSARKLIGFGSTALCGLSGLLRFTRTEYDPRGDEFDKRTEFELADVVERLTPVSEVTSGLDAVGVFANRLHVALAPVWERFTTDLDEPFGCNRDEPNGCVARSMPLAQLVYVDRDRSGRVVVATVDLKHSLRQTGCGRYSSLLELPVLRRLHYGATVRLRLFVRGARRCVRSSPCCGPVGSDSEALRSIEGIFKCAQEFAPCAAAIGGPVDVGAIDVSGRRWIKRKEAMSGDDA